MCCNASPAPRTNCGLNSVGKTHLCAFNFFNLLFQAQPGQSLRLSWKQCKDMPFAMSNNTHSVVLKGKLYMGGGCASGNSQVECTVMVYDIRSGEWSTLPKHQVIEVVWYGLSQK